MGEGRCKDQGVRPNAPLCRFESHNYPFPYRHPGTVLNLPSLSLFPHAPSTQTPLMHPSRRRDRVLVLSAHAARGGRGHEGRPGAQWPHPLDAGHPL